MDVCAGGLDHSLSGMAASRAVRLVAAVGMGGRYLGICFCGSSFPASSVATVGEVGLGLYVIIRIYRYNSGLCMALS